ncbi:MAG: glycosyltransferase family 4 protein [Candidatus Hydrogenedentes bacterium]|nr:glycosyltransferase family 4 protein [Candidatus Hydrogenedentota bacterium]
MSNRPLRIGLDVSCIAESPMTGIGYAALNQLRALLRRVEAFEFHLFATGDRSGKANLEDLLPFTASHAIFRRARLVKYHLWTRLSWPPIEWSCGPLDIAHNFSHHTPATKEALRVVTVHDLSFLRHPETHTARTIEVQTRLVRQVAREADAVVAVSQSCKSEMVELLGIPEDRIHVVPNGIHPEEFAGPLDSETLDVLKQRLGISREYFIQLGTVEPRKNIPRLVEAYARLREKRREVPQLVFVGKPGWKCEASFHPMKPLAETKDIVYAGYVDRSEAVLLLRGALACVYPSIYEGFGLPVLEAMAARTPVITSNTSSMPEVAGDTALLVNPTDVDSITCALEQTFDDRIAADSRAEAAFTRAQTFTWERSAETLAGLYRTLADKRGAR